MKLTADMSKTLRRRSFGLEMMPMSTARNIILVLVGVTSPVNANHTIHLTSLKNLLNHGHDRCISMRVYKLLANIFTEDDIVQIVIEGHFSDSLV
mgnify:CR=1 FL=1